MGVLRIIYLIPAMLRISKQSPQAIKRLQDRRLRKLLRFAVANSPFYRDHYKGIDIETCRITDLPPVTKPLMMEHFDDFVTDRRLKRLEIRNWLADKSNQGGMYLGEFIPFQTSGTTGENALVVYDRRGIDYAHAAVMARHAQKDEKTLWDFVKEFFRVISGDKIPMATIVMTGGPYPAYTAARYAPKAHELFVDHRVYSLLDPVDKIVEGLNAHQPEQIVSYPSLLEILAREQLAGRLKLKFSSNRSSLATGSEPLSATTRRLAKKAWNMDIQDTYGTSECFIMARSCGRFDRMHVMSDLCVLEVVDRNFQPVPDGQLGEKILITNLFNYVQPFIRYEVSDVTGYSTEPCSCGQGFPTLLPVAGRTDDIFYIDRPGGGYEAVHPYKFLGPIVELDQVKEYQLVQTGRNEVTFNYVPARGDENAEDSIRRVLEDGMKAAAIFDRMTLKLQQLDQIPRHPKSGKFRQIVSEIGAPEDLDEAERMNH